MASPFSKFRKNQKLMMAILGVLVMVAFLILPTLLEFSQNTGTTNTDVVSTSYGVLTELDLQNMAKRRDLANKFINNALMRANFQQRPTPFGRPNDQADLVETMLRYRKAEELGLYVPDNRVVAMLDTLTDKKVDGDGFSQIAQQLGVQQSQVMDALRYELMADQYEQLHFPATQIQTPVSRWEIFQSLNREVSAEVIPLEVDKLIDPSRMKRRCGRFLNSTDSTTRRTTPSSPASNSRIAWRSSISKSSSTTSLRKFQ